MASRLVSRASHSPVVGGREMYPCVWMSWLCDRARLALPVPLVTRRTAYAVGRG
jgi:hypothetical protein